MLKTILFLGPWRCFDDGFVIDFRPGVNLIVGDQGTGKSSLFQAIQLKGMKKTKSWHLPPADSVPAVVNCPGKPVPVFAFDFELDNFRTKPFFDDEIPFHVGAMFHSHGEMVLSMLGAMEQIDKIMLVLVDEPDMALSIRSCYRLIRIFKHVAELGGQVIATAHNSIVIGGFEEVYSIEHQKWMPSQEFIDSQMNPLPIKEKKKPAKKKVKSNAQRSTRKRTKSSR